MTIKDNSCVSTSVKMQVHMPVGKKVERNDNATKREKESIEKERRKE
jgi:hypothetical protein